MVAWSRLAELKRILTSSRLRARLRLRLRTAFVTYTLFFGCESWKLIGHVRRRLNDAASKLLSRITERSIAFEARNLDRRGNAGARL